MRRFAPGKISLRASVGGILTRWTPVLPGVRRSTEDCSHQWLSPSSCGPSWLASPDELRLCCRRLYATGSTNNGNNGDTGDETEEVPSTFFADRAASDQSCCRYCGFKIPKGTLRLGSMTKGLGDFQTVSWSHPECFKATLLRYPGAMTPQRTKGILTLDDNDYQTVMQLIDPSKKNHKKPKELVEAAKEVKRAADELSTVMKQGLVSILQANKHKHHRPPSPKEMTEILADALAFGWLSPCDVCGGSLAVRSSHYACTGHLDEFTKCRNRMTEVTRTKLQLPNDLPKLVLERLHKFPGVASPKERPLLPHVEEDPSAPAPQPEGEKALSYMRIVCLLPPKEFAALEQKVKKCGGKLLKDVPSDFGPNPVDIAIVEKSSSKNTIAKAKGALCFSPELIDFCAEKGYRPSLGEVDSEWFVANRPAMNALTARNVQKREERKVRLQKQEDNNSTTQKVVVQEGIAVDPDFTVAGDAALLKDNKGWYSVTMSKTDLSTGKNSFYILQAMKRGQSWYVFRKWGRVGSIEFTDWKTDTFNRVLRATTTFDKYFSERSGHDWAGDSASYPPQAGKYTVLAMKRAESSTDDNGKKTKLTSTLPKETQKLISLLFDKDEITHALGEMEIDLKKMPLGNITTSTIKHGYAALSKVNSILDEAKKEHLAKTVESTGPSSGKKGKGSASGRKHGGKKADPAAAMPTSLKFDDLSKKHQQQLVAASNRFYTYIPHTIKQSEVKSAVIDSVDKVAQKTNLLDDLSQIEITSKLMQNATSGLDSQYNALNADIVPVDANHADYKMIETYMKNTYGHTHSVKAKLKHVWTLDRSGEEQRFAPWAADDNRMLLWHGSRLTNWVGIISQGLRIAPPEAPSTGYMFGKGIYFADMYSKSANYCGYGSHKLMALCEVALGKPVIRLHSDYITELPKGHSSCFAKGDYAPSSSITQPCGMVVPLGENKRTDVKGSSLSYNEFIVYDIAQVRMRYLLLLDD